MGITNTKMNLAFIKAILKFCTTKKLFSYFRRRYNDDKMKDLNNILKLQGKIKTLQFSTKFLKECIIKRVSPRFITFRIQKSKVRPSPTIERANLNFDQ